MPAVTPADTHKAQFSTICLVARVPKPGETDLRLYLTSTTTAKGKGQGKGHGKSQPSPKAHPNITLLGAKPATLSTP